MQIEQAELLLLLDPHEREPFDGIPLPIAIRVRIESGTIGVTASVPPAATESILKGDATKPKKPVRRKDVKPVPISTTLNRPDGVGVSQDGCLLWTKNGEVWVCPVSTTERKLAKAVAEHDGKLDGNLAYQILWPDLGLDEGKRMRDLQGSLNKKLERRPAPVRMSFADWCVTFVEA